MPLVFLKSDCFYPLKKKTLLKKNNNYKTTPKRNNLLVILPDTQICATPKLKLWLDTEGTLICENDTGTANVGKPQYGQPQGCLSWTQMETTPLGALLNGPRVRLRGWNSGNSGWMENGCWLHQMGIPRLELGPNRGHQVPKKMRVWRTEEIIKEWKLWKGSEFGFFEPKFQSVRLNNKQKNGNLEKRWFFFEPKEKPGIPFLTHFGSFLCRHKKNIRCCPTIGGHIRMLRVFDQAQNVSKSRRQGDKVASYVRGPPWGGQMPGGKPTAKVT